MGLVLTAGVMLLAQSSRHKQPTTHTVVVNDEEGPPTALPIQFEWADTNSAIAERRQQLLKESISVSEFCRQYPNGCETFVRSYTDLLVRENGLASELLRCRLEYETSDAQSICDAGRWIAVANVEGVGRVVYVAAGFGKSKEAACTMFQRCVVGVYTAAVLPWPEDCDQPYLVHGHALRSPGGYHPETTHEPHRDRYVRLLESAHQGEAFDREVMQGTNLDELSPQARLQAEYRRIMTTTHTEDLLAMLDAIK
jgi:hypothetical protein